MVGGFPYRCYKNSVHKNGTEQPAPTSAYDGLQKTGRSAPLSAEPPIALSVSMDVVILLVTTGFIYVLLNYQSCFTKIGQITIKSVTCV